MAKLASKKTKEHCSLGEALKAHLMKERSKARAAVLQTTMTIKEMPEFGKTVNSG